MSALLKIIPLLLLLPLITCNIYTPKSESNTFHPINTIKTIGSASASIKPDQVSLSFSISSLSKTASQALAENNEILKGAIINLKAANLNEEEIGTSSFSIGQKQELQDQLLTQAVKNAKEKADLALEPLKARVNGLVSLDLANTQPQTYYPIASNSKIAYDAIERTDLHASNQDITVEVAAVFEIGQGIDVSSVFP